jgi:hypothetical protein
MITMKKIFNSRTLYPYKGILEKTPFFFEKAKPFVENTISLGLFIIPLVFPSSRFLCSVVFILNQSNKKSGIPILQSSFVFYDNQVNAEGKNSIVYNKTNILLASFGTVLMGSILVYFLYPRNPRVLIPSPLSKLPETKVFVPLLPTLENLSDLKINCNHVEHMQELLTKFLHNASDGVFPPIEVQKYFLKWLSADMNDMKTFLVENKEWFIPFSVTDPSALKCLSNMKKLDPLYNLTCETSLLLKAYCDSLPKN